MQVARGVPRILIAVCLSGWAVPSVAEEPCVWKTSDIIDPRIDIGAQQALFRMMSSGLPNSRVASAMIGAVKSEALAGILLPPRQAVAERARSLDPPRGHWQLLEGRNSICLLEPEGEPPLVVYRENLSRDAIIEALLAAWPECNLPTPDPPCGYTVDRWKPPEGECSTDDQCVDKGLGFFCRNRTCIECDTNQDCINLKIGNVCIEVAAPEMAGKKVCALKSDGEDEDTEDCWFDAHCLDGFKCTGGRCVPDGPEPECYERVHTEWRQKDKQCEDDEFPRLVACAAEHWGNPLPLANCLRESYEEKTTCKKTAWLQFETRKKECVPAAE